jgi:hypothetical protein
MPAALCQRAREVRAAALGSGLDDLLRMAEISGCLEGDHRSIRRAGPRPEPLPDGRRVRALLLPSSLYAVDRSTYPDDRNNGRLWAGVGVSSALRTGLQVQVPFITAVVRPELLYQENRDFDTIDRERVGYSPLSSAYYATIDFPQRFGLESWWNLIPGDSYVRADLAWAAAGASTESLWRGPAARYPILMSNTAGGFPHLFAGTSRGVDLWIGRLSGELVWGRLTESDYFDETPDNDQTGIANVAVVFEPRWLTGLSLGVTRSHLYRPGPNELDEVLAVLGLDTNENPLGNDLASMFGRWVFRDAGAEVYGEMAREDVLGPWPHFLMEPDHSQAYMLGVQKVTSVNPSLALRVQGELVALQEKGELRTNSRPLPIYYRHSRVRQGYTHRGQLLGAAVGPGADAQFLALDALFGWGTVGAYYERVRRNDQTPEAVRERRWYPYEHDVEVIGGLRATYFRGPIALWTDIARSYRYNRDFGDDDTNWRTEIRLTWSPTLEWTW